MLCLHLQFTLKAPHQKTYSSQCTTTAEAGCSQLSRTVALYIIWAVSEVFLNIIWTVFWFFFSRFKFPLCPNIFKFLSIKNNCQLHSENTPVLFLLHQLKSPLSSKSFSMSSGLFPKSFLPHQAKWRYTCLCIEAVLHNFCLSNKDPSISSRYLATSSAIDWSLPSCLTFLMRRITLELYH